MTRAARLSCCAGCITRKRNRIIWHGIASLDSSRRRQLRGHASGSWTTRRKSTFQGGILGWEVARFGGGYSSVIACGEHERGPEDRAGEWGSLVRVIATGHVTAGGCDGCWSYTRPLICGNSTWRLFLNHHHLHNQHSLPHYSPVKALPSALYPFSIA